MCSKPLDFSHHLSNVSKSRKVSPLKGLQKYMYNAPEGMISLAAGFPDPKYFPFESVSGETLAPEAFPRAGSSDHKTSSTMLGSSSGTSQDKTLESITVPKHGTGKGAINLASAMQYAPATGFQPLQDFIRDFTAQVYKPGSTDWVTLAHVGNTNGIHRALTTLCNPGERILVEEWTYVSALIAAQPMGILPATVKMDGYGMSSVDLERVLLTWDEEVEGSKRPHVLYLVPVGQNPTGTTMSAERKQAIYDICVKYDIIIIEDDPYYFMQEGPYVRQDKRQPHKEMDESQFLESLVPSFVRYDCQGRVIRLDSFSKFIAPGARMGWFTCNPFFAERLEREGETTTQMPCGLSQALIVQLLSKQWGITGLIRWLQGLQAQYTTRRDYLVDCIFEEFDVQQSFDSAFSSLLGDHSIILTAYTKVPGKPNTQDEISSHRTPLFSFSPPSSGFFVWLKFHIKTGVSIPGDDSEGTTVNEKIWIDLTKNGLLVAPGWVISALPGVDTSINGEEQELTFRLAYSYGSFSDMKAGIKILAEVMGKYV